jgi:capsular exopolysaccharide synthesis family protein
MSFQSELQMIDAQPESARETHGFRPIAPSITLQPDKRSRLVFVTDPHGLAVEQYKLLRRRLCTLSPRGGLILVTSPGAGEGKTLTSVNLSMCLGQGGDATCLVDMDFRAPGVMASLGCKLPDEGVAEVLAESCPISQALRQIGTERLYVLGIKERLQSPSAQLSSIALRLFLKELKEKFKWVILDMAPSIAMSDVAEVLPHVDGSLMVIRSGKTSKALIAPTIELLGRSLWGVVFNDSVIEGSEYYGYYGHGDQHQRG